MTRFPIFARRALAPLLAAATLTALAAPPATNNAPASSAAHLPLKPRKDVKGIGNFAQVSPTLYRGNQPTAEGFAELKKMGVKTIISLRSGHDDAALLKGTGLNYIRIECAANKPSEPNVIAFFKLINDPASQPVFVHCAAGADRTGLMVAVYRMANCGWTAAEAMAEMPNFKFNSKLDEVKTYLKALDVDALKKKAETATAPKLDRID